MELAHIDPLHQQNKRSMTPPVTSVLLALSSVSLETYMYLPTAVNKDYNNREKVSLNRRLSIVSIGLFLFLF